MDFGGEADHPPANLLKPDMVDSLLGLEPSYLRSELLFVYKLIKAAA